MQRVLTLFFGITFSVCMSQSNTNWTMDWSYFRGNITLHNNDVLHLIKGHPEGIILSWNKTTHGEKQWHQHYNYPDYGISFSYQNLKNDVLGKNYAVYGHYNFYWLNRRLMLRIGQGLAVTTNAYDKIENPTNIAFGSTIMSSTFAMLNFKQENLIDKFGVQAGISFIHYSNANVKAPNTSINTLAFNLGINYKLDDETTYVYTSSEERFTQPIKFNVVFRSGVNESDVVGSGQYPFYVFSAYADKRLTYKSAIQFGADAFFSKFLEELIYYQSVAFPELNVDPDTDYKRVGVFAGHELFINRLSVVTQLGFYVYYPYDFEGRVYQRIGVKYYIGDKWFGALTLKAHAAQAEALELGIGIRL